MKPETVTITKIEIKDLGAELPLIFPLVIHFFWNNSSSEFVAECPLFNLHAIGETLEKSLNNLKELMASDYQNFLKDHPYKLTEDAINLLRLYRAFMGKNYPES